MPHAQPQLNGSITSHLNVGNSDTLCVPPLRNLPKLSEREAQILAEVRRGAGTARELTRRVYGELDDRLMVAAEMTMRAHLKKLVDDGAVRSAGEGDQEVFDAPVS